MIAHLEDPKRRLLMPWIPNGRPAWGLPMWWQLRVSSALCLASGHGSQGRLRFHDPAALHRPLGRSWLPPS